MCRVRRQDARQATAPATDPHGKAPAPVTEVVSGLRKTPWWNQRIASFCKPGLRPIAGRSGMYETRCYPLIGNAASTRG